MDGKFWVDLVIRLLMLLVALKLMRRLRRFQRAEVRSYRELEGRIDERAFAKEQRRLSKLGTSWRAGRIQTSASPPCSD